MTGEERPNYNKQVTVQKLENKSNYNSYLQTSYYNDYYQVHLLEKQGSGQFPRNPISHQVVIVNSEEQYSKDKPRQFNSSSKSENGVIIKDNSKEETSLE